MGRRRVSDGEVRNSFVGRMVDRPATNHSTNALAWGIAWLIIGSIAGWYFWIMPTSSFGFVVTGYVPLKWHVVVNLVLWVVSCAVLFMLGTFINRKFRTIELFGRLLFAHWPVLLLMLPAILGSRHAYSLFVGGLMQGDMSLTFNIQPMYSTFMVFFFIAILLWYLYWSYVAFRKVVGCRGWMNVALFIVAMWLSFELSKVTVTAMYKEVL